MQIIADNPLYLLVEKSSAIAQDKNVIYIGGDDFKKEYISALDTNRITSFVDRFIDCDILIFNMDGLTSKEQPNEITQEYFYHVIMRRVEQHKPIFFLGNTSPDKIEGLENRIKDRYMNNIIRVTS